MNHKISVCRRHFLKMATLSLTIAPLEAKTLQRRPFFERHGLPIGLQLYTLGDMEFGAALRQAADIGYRTVEITLPRNMEPPRLAEAFRGTGLTCHAMQVNPIADLDTLAAAARAIGVRCIMTSMVDSFSRIRPDAGINTAQAMIATAQSMMIDDWKRDAEQLNATGRQLKRHGLKFAYHNHNHEFAPRFDGRSGYDILLDSTDPALVSFELDVGWAAAAGRDPVALLRAHRGRFTHMHVKDITAATTPNFSFQQQPADVGDGILDWGAILSAAYDAGVRHFYVEREPPFPTNRIVSAQRSFEYLSKVPG